jgi:hypothetical protein
MEKEDIDDYIAAYYRTIFNTIDSVYEISRRFDDTHKMPSGTGISIFEYLIIRKIINVNLKVPLDFSNAIQINSAKELYCYERN